MGYLDNSTITVDAILTKKGREYLAQGRTNFNITQFALADDEIDYDLWNPAHPLGSDYYGVVIENMPITEAVPDETQSMKYKLVTLPKGTTNIPYLAADKSTISVTDASNGVIRIDTFYYSGITGANGTQNTLNGSEGYTVTLLDSTYVTMLTQTQNATIVNNGMGMSVATSEVAIVRPTQGSNSIEVILVAKSGVESLPAGVVKSTKLIVTGNETGGRVIIPVTIENV